MRGEICKTSHGEKNVDGAVSLTVVAYDVERIAREPGMEKLRALEKM